MDDVRTRLGEIEAALRRIPGVRAAAVHTDERGRITAIHVVADGRKPAKAQVRDVQAVLAAVFRIDVDHRVVSIVEIPEDEPSPATSPESAGGRGEGGGSRGSVTGVGSPGDDDDEDRASEIPGVRQISVERDAEGRVVKVHVVVTGGTPAHQLVRAVQAWAFRRFGLTIEHPVISIVEIPDAPSDVAVPGRTHEPRPSWPGLRPALVSIGWQQADREQHVVVTLTIGPHVLTGQASGPAGPANRPRIVARATLAAVVELLGVLAEVESVQVVDAGAHQVALVVIALEIPRLGTQVLVGSAIVRGDLDDAVARAVLAALNRQLAG